MNTSVLNGVDVKAFLEPEPVPPEGVQRAAKIIQSGKMFRYGASGPEDSEVSRFERVFAEYMGTKYALAVNSCSSAIEIALRAVGGSAGTKILVPAFTFTAVPSAIVNIGAIPILVECNENYRVDPHDLKKKITHETDIFLLSHMRGQICDMDAIMELCGAFGVTVVEDAAHGLGARFCDKLAGSFGAAGCFSFQSNKIVNSGEGGMLTTDDPEIMAKAVILSGAYERLHEKHFYSRELNDFFIKYRKLLAPHNMRMAEHTAAIAYSQLAYINARARTYREHYAYLTEKLSVSERIELPVQDKRELRAPDSVQFRLKGFSERQMQRFMEAVRRTNLPLSAFGADEDNARVPWNWQYIKEAPQVPKTRAHLKNACDMRLPSTLTTQHLDFLADTILAAVRETA